MFPVNRRNPGFDAITQAIELQAKWDPFSVLTAREMFLLVYMSLTQDETVAIAALTIMKKLEGTL